MSNEDRSQDDFTFLCGLVALLVMLADGHLDKKEIGRLDQAFRDNPILAKSDPRLELKEIHSFLKDGDNVNLEEMLSNLHLNDDLKKQGLEIGLEIATSDGSFTKEEESKLLEIIKYLRLSESFGLELVKRGKDQLGMMNDE